mmetsp:Transcript_2076/g.2780  ORF Transcript_2076/g.2780 Transcript_2076/m.2780 type:complete len:359 (-) Transcript_2076:128-1204(-)|eukprot:CAMPEP_0116063876 /NCGR_PEP_ID=MMETSP0322-20121206/8722_1 /TAXON_ID=163516 /ORGANISM="Leptocylindrus danicus var. apora, Strain B651" /LENGTH=358 /DNA_ID=CAMNT_0003549671 /DNA_START=129 /DNA_END=1205 /DNA_ORIENTATION=-
MGPKPNAVDVVMLPAREEVCDSGTSDVQPENIRKAKKLALQQKLLKEQWRHLRKRLVLASTDDDSLELVRAACIDSLDTVGARLEGEALILLGSLNGNSGIRGTSGENTSLASIFDAQCQRVRWAQTRAQTYLNAVENAANNASSAATELYQAGVDYNSVQSSERVFVSPWCLQKLAFDVIVGKSSIVSIGKQCNSVSVLSDVSESSETDPSLPISVEVRAISEVVVSNDDSPISASNSILQSVMPKCEVEIINVTRRVCPEDKAYGDVTLLLALRPSRGSGVDEAKSKSNLASFQVTQARIIQYNAIPPCPFSSVELYSSSISDSEELTISLRFLTKRSQNDDKPQLLIDLLVRSNK